MSNDVQSPVVVNSPTRFSVVGPGVSYPTEIVSSGADTADFVGQYSLREAGLDSILNGTDIRPPRSLLTDFVFFAVRSNGQKISDRRTVAIDCWIDGPQGRKDLYSLIFEVKNFYVARRTVKFYSEKLEQQLSILAVAFRENDHDKIMYIGKMIAAFVELVNQHAEYANRIMGFELRFFQFIFTVVFTSSMVVIVLKYAFHVGG